MTRYEKQQRIDVLERDGEICCFEGCERRCEGIAHFIPQRKWVIKIYGIKRIHHKSNMCCSCNEHNAFFQINPNSEYELREQIVFISEAILAEGF